MQHPYTTRQKRYVVCIEGPHGMGKTSCVKELRARGHACRDEGFLDMPANDLHPQGLVTELMWSQRLFTEALEQRERVAFVDRSPFSAVMYTSCDTETRALIHRVLQAEVRELKSVDIIFITVCLYTRSRSPLWDRIQARLRANPEREKYNEGDKNHMHAMCERYDSAEWDVRVEVAETVPETVNAIEAAIQPLIK